MDLIRVQSISKGYGDFVAIENTTFSIARSTINVIMGPNSSGKTTIAKILAGVEKYDSGSIVYNFSGCGGSDGEFGVSSGASSQEGAALDSVGRSGVCYGSEDSSNVGSNFSSGVGSGGGKGVSYVGGSFGISYLPQNFATNSYLPINCGAIYKYITLDKGVVKNSEVLKEILDFCEFSKIKNKYPSELSGGMLRRFLISCSLARQSDLIILDEPTQNLDVASEGAFYELILLMKQRMGITFIIVSHDLHSVMKYTDQVICIQNHLCCSGTPSDIMLSDLFGFYEHRHDHRHSH